MLFLKPLLAYFHSTLAFVKKHAQTILRKRVRQQYLLPDTTHPCPVCGLPATILVDLETETVPNTDKDGNKQYYCSLCLRKFSVDKQGVAGALSLP